VTALGLGAVWVATYPRAEREDKVQRTLHLPKEWRTLCLVPVGHPAEAKAPRTQYDSARVHYEAF